jgi:hypothetical protein
VGQLIAAKRIRPLLPNVDSPRGESGLWTEKAIRPLTRKEFSPSDVRRLESRKDFTTLEAVGLGQRLEGMERRKAAERKAEGQKSGGRGRKKLAAESADSLGETRVKVAASIGMSHDTYTKAKAVVASGDKEAIDLMQSTGKAVVALRHFTPNGL